MTKVRLRGYVAGALAPALLAIAGPAPAANLNFVPTAQISLPNGQQIISFDISFVDSVIQLYFLADRTNKSTDVVQTSNNHFQVQLTANPPFTGATGNNDTSGPDGVITVRHQETWNGDGGSTIKVINLFNRQTTHVINTGGKNRADELCLDPRDNVVLMANDAEVTLSIRDLHIHHDVCRHRQDRDGRHNKRGERTAHPESNQRHRTVCVGSRDRAFLYQYPGSQWPR